MCAIFGSINIDINKDSINKCLRAMNHRGPDNNGTYLDEKNKLILAHNRLEILDLKMGFQPMISRDESCILVYNGEIYNFQDLRAELESLGHKFLTNNSDTEVLIHGYKEWKEKLPEHLDGMWAFAIYDKTNNEVFLSRDRFGEKPLFYYFNNSMFLFASELSAFTSLSQLKLDIDFNNLKKYCAHGFFPASLTPYKNIFKLQGGHNMVLKISSMEIVNQKYWEYTLEPNYQLNEKDWSDQIYSLLDKSVKKRLVADVPVGIFLSGGLDSSIISMLAQKNSKDKINTFSINFSEESFDESKYADYISNKINSTHYSKSINSKNIEGIWKEFFEKIDEPISDSSLLSYYSLCKFSRTKVKVALGGDAADELIAGYDTFKALKYAHIFKNLGIFKARPLINYLTTKIPTNYSYMNLKFKIERFFRFTGKEMALANLNWLSPLNSNEISEIFGEKISEEELYSEAIDLWKKNNYSNNLDKSLEFFTKLFLQDQILVKTDRLSMMNGLEVRSPFLDRDLVNCIRKIPNKLKLKGNITKFILQKTFEKDLGKNFVNRRKIGFSTPISKFFLKDNNLFKLKSNFLKKRSNIFDNKILEHRKYVKENRIYLWNILNLDNFLSKNQQ